MSKIVVLEVGHGPWRDRYGYEGIEYGCSGAGTTEYHEVCIQSDIVEAELRALGYKVLVLDPEETLERIGSMSVGADIMVSLHLNAFNQHVQGTEVLIHRAGTADDQRLASIIQRELVNELGLPDRGVRRQGLAVLGSVPPSVDACCLVESFFLDSMPDLDTARDHTERAATAIAKGIDSYARLY